MARSLLLFSLCIAACTPQSADVDSSAPDGVDTDVTVDVEPTPECVVDSDCEDGNPCTGEETCSSGVCLSGTPVVCDGFDEVCVVEGDDAVCTVLCDLPVAPMLAVLTEQEPLWFTGPAEIETSVIEATESLDEAVWTLSSTVDLSDWWGAARVLARSTDPSCEADEVFDHTYQVDEAFPGPAGTETSWAIGIADEAIVAWATGHSEVTWGDDVATPWQDPSYAYGPAEGSSTLVTPLGRGGSLTLTFDVPIADGEGDDFVVFENSFSDSFLELGFVEVSSDGTVFVRFDSAAHMADPVDEFGALDPMSLNGVAGVYRQGFGTPFDLSLLRYAVGVRSGQVDLSQITHVRVVDVVGDGTDRDSWDRPIYDPFPTMETAGFDLDGVGVIHQALP
jgi:hypothetical protein